MRRGNQRVERRGANAIEFALTLPVFLVLIMGIIDYGFYFGGQAVLDAAVLEGTRLGAITDPADGADLEDIAETRMEEIASMMCGSNCVYNCEDRTVNLVIAGDTEPIRELACTINWPITPLVGLVPMPSNITSRGRQLLEWQRNGG